MSEQNTDSSAEREMTVEQAIELTKKYGAGIIKIIPRDDNDEPVGAVIVASKESAPAVIRAIEQLQEQWEKEAPVPAQPLRHSER
jgi:hypothetical protein